MFTVENVKEMLANANYGKFTVTMSNNDVLTVTPCTQMVDTITSVDEIEYYLVDGSSLVWLGGDNLETIVRQFNEYESQLKELEDEKVELRKFYQEKIAPKLSDPSWKSYEDDNFQTYSDWHKDVYGYRPRNLVA